MTINLDIMLGAALDQLIDEGIIVEGIEKMNGRIFKTFRFANEIVLSDVLRNYYDL